MEKISGVYKITNIETNDCYIGSSVDVKRRWSEHRRHSTWKRCPNNKLYDDIQKYGLDKFQFQILKIVEQKYLKEIEQEFIETLNPVYNNYRAKGLDIERRKETKKKCQKEYRQSEKGKEIQRKCQKKYRQSKKVNKLRKKINSLKNIIKNIINNFAYIIAKK